MDAMFENLSLRKFYHFRNAWGVFLVDAQYVLYFTRLKYTKFDWKIRNLQHPAGKGVTYLTYRSAKDSKEGDIANVEPEIEITLEMVEAGALALSEYDKKLESLKEGDIRIFWTMAACRAPSPPIPDRRSSNFRTD
jgi:hypothetical protein